MEVTWKIKIWLLAFIVTFELLGVCWVEFQSSWWIIHISNLKLCTKRLRYLSSYARPLFFFMQANEPLCAWCILKNLLMVLVNEYKRDAQRHWMEDTAGHTFCTSRWLTEPLNRHIYTLIALIVLLLVRGPQPAKLRGSCLMQLSAKCKLTWLWWGALSRQLMYK